MYFPEFIAPGDCIGVTAPSDGNHKEIDFKRVSLATKHFEDRGYPVIKTENVFTSEGGRSSDAKSRVEQLMDLVEQSSVKNIILAKGGDFLMEILPQLDFEKIRRNPKWIQGYSDSTGLLFTVTTKMDMATIYGYHFNEFAMEPWHLSLENNWNFLQGKEVISHNYERYEDGFYDRETGTEGFFLGPNVQWHTKDGYDQIHMQGRILGGCLDVLLNLCGTKYDNVAEYIERYKKDGILWYLESFSLDAESLTRGLWQLREAGWFSHAKGILFGRPCFFESFLGYTYEEAAMSVLEPLNIPVVFGGDIGHKPPMIYMVNGALGEFDYHKGNVTLKTTLK